MARGTFEAGTVKASAAFSWMVLGIALGCGQSEHSSGRRGATGSGGAAGRGTGGTGQGGGGGTSLGGTTGNVGGTTGNVGAAGGAGDAGSGPSGTGGSAAGDGGSGDAGGRGGMSGNAGDGSSGGAGAGGAGQGGAGGSSGAAGTGGSGGAGGLRECVSIAELFPAVAPTGQTSGLEGTASPPNARVKGFDGYCLQSPCADTACDDCSAAGWRWEGLDSGCSNGLVAVQNFVVGGTPGQTYRVTFHFYGVVEPRDYGPNVTRESGTTRPNNLNAGAMPPPWAYATGSPTLRDSMYGTWELHVVDHQGNDVCSYFLNSDTTEEHLTYILNFERTIDVIGGGRIRIRRVDSDCRIIKNCFINGMQGACSASGCNNRARVVDISAANPQPMGLSQPGLIGDSSQSGQWLLVDVTNVQCAAAALGCDGM